MPFLNVFYNFHDIFAKKSIEKKIFSFKKYGTELSTECIFTICNALQCHL